MYLVYTALLVLHTGVNVFVCGDEVALVEMEAAVIVPDLGKLVIDVVPGEVIGRIPLTGIVISLFVYGYNIDRVTGTTAIDV